MADEWIIGMGSGAALSGALWALKRGAYWVKSRRGDFRGTYLAITQMGDEMRLHVEVVKVKHAGEQLHGSMSAIASLELGARGSIENAESISAEYAFAGSTKNRLITMHYSSSLRSSQNAGTFLLSIDPKGEVFRGKWTGTTEAGKIIHGETLWFLIGKLGARFPDPRETVDLAEDGLDNLQNPWRKPAIDAAGSMTKMLVSTGMPRRLHFRGTRKPRSSTPRGSRKMT